MIGAKGAEGAISWFTTSGPERMGKARRPVPRGFARYIFQRSIYQEFQNFVVDLGRRRLAVSKTQNFNKSD
jgi:hypothetical protein